MATSSAPSTLSPSLYLSHLPSSTRPKLSSLPFPTRPHPNPHIPIISLRRPNSPFHRPFASPEAAGSSETLEPPLEALEGTEVGALEGDGTSPLPAGADDGGKMPPKQKIRIKLRSYWVPLIEDSCKKIMDAARTSNAKTMGPVPLPTKRRIYCVVRSPHVNKDSRFHFEIRTHQRLIDILHPTAQTIDSLMMVDIPAGVDVEVKL